jgi:hypothetical protein
VDQVATVEHSEQAAAVVALPLTPRTRVPVELEELLR